MRAWPGPEAGRPRRTRDPAPSPARALEHKDAERRAWPAVREAAAGAAGVTREPAQLRTYECDGLTGYRVAPALVVLPGSTEEVQAAVQICGEAGVPFVARGAGTGL